VTTKNGTISDQKKRDRAMVDALRELLGMEPLYFKGDRVRSVYLHEQATPWKNPGGRTPRRGAGQ
jgi:hypothetical protein